MLAFSTSRLPPFLQPLPNLQPWLQKWGEAFQGRDPGLSVFLLPASRIPALQLLPLKFRLHQPHVFSGCQALRQGGIAVSVQPDPLCSTQHWISIRNPGSRGITLIFSHALSQSWPDTLVTRGESQIILHSPKQNGSRGWGEDANWKQMCIER